MANRELAIPIVVSKRRKLQNRGDESTDLSPAVGTSVQVPDKEIDPDILSEVVKEENVGITRFVNTTKVFGGILKHRFSDFIVNEIFKDNGNKVLCKFDDVNPTLPVDEKESDIMKEKRGLDDLYKDLQDISSSPELIEAVQNVYKMHTDKKDAMKKEENNHDDDDKIVLDIKNPIFTFESEDKTKRKRLYNIIREDFGLLRASASTDEKFKGRAIDIFHNHDDKAVKKDVPRKKKYKHLQLYMYKENIDTMSAVGMMSSYLKKDKPKGKIGGKNRFFQYAGTKDKRGMTCQRMTCGFVEIEKLQKINEKMNNIKVGHFKIVDDPISLGDLLGNQFSVIIREIDSSSIQDMSKGLDTIKEQGFYNYFGMQRFGVSAIPTSSLGKAILQNDFTKFCRLLLTPRAGEQHVHGVTDARKFYQNNPHLVIESIKKFNRRYTAEISVLRARARKKGDREAYGTIPYNLRTMYVHAYQSLVFNNMVNERLTLGSNEYAIEGDLIVPDPDTYPNEAKLSTKIHPKDRKKKVLHFVTKEEEENKTFSIFRVVLPTVGFAVFLPINLKEKYKAYLGKDNLNMDSFQGGNIKDLGLSGAYRNIMIKPGNFKWEFITYYNPNITLALSDYEKKTGKMLEQVEPSDEFNKKLHALRLDFSLPPSAYATMLFREIVGASSDISRHIQLSKAREQLKISKQIQL